MLFSQHISKLDMYEEWQNVFDGAPFLIGKKENVLNWSGNVETSKTCFFFRTYAYRIELHRNMDIVQYHSAISLLSFTGYKNTKPKTEV